MDYLRNKNKALLVEVEVTEGTYQTMDATNAVPIEDLQSNLNPETLESNEASASLDEGEVTVTGFKPNLTGTALIRPSGSVTVAPRIDPLLQACGLAGAAAAVIPASGTTDAASGTTTSFVVDRTVGTGTQWSATNGAYIGRAVRLTTNPATPKVAMVVDYQVVGNNATVTIDQTLPVALSATTDAQLLPGYFYELISTGIPAISMGYYKDGKLRRFTGGRGTCGFRIEGGKEGRFTFDMKGSFLDETDAAIPAGVDFSTLAPPPLWRDGLSSLDKTLIAATSLELNLQLQTTQHPNPNVVSGFDVAISTRRQIRGTLQLNTQLVATKDMLTKLVGNTKMSFGAIMDVNKAAGLRVGIVVPYFKMLDSTEADFEGISDDQVPFQAYGSDTGVTVLFF